jgi:hypothetical protein
MTSAHDGGTADLLPAERARASFSVDALTTLIVGRQPATIAKFKPLFSDGIFDDTLDDYASYSDLFEKKLQRVTAAFKIVRENPSFQMTHMSQRVRMGDMLGDRNGIFVHFTMTMNYIRSQANPEQFKYWMERAQNGDFIAAYCQTELGHGSNVRGLETTATFDPATDEFEIHSPTLTSLKWWPTGMVRESLTHSPFLPTRADDATPPVCRPPVRVHPRPGVRAAHQRRPEPRLPRLHATAARLGGRAHAWRGGQAGTYPPVLLLPLGLTHLPTLLPAHLPTNLPTYPPTHKVGEIGPKMNGTSGNIGYR